MRVTRQLVTFAGVLLSACAVSDNPEKTVTESSVIDQTLIDVDQNIHIESWSASSAELAASAPADGEQESVSWSIRKDVLHGGRQEGVDRVRIDNGVLSFTIIPTRGMSIWDARVGDLSLGWDSPVKEVVHPQYVHLDTRGGLGWLEGFGALMCRCGLASNGAPGEDLVRTNTGSIVPTTLTLHGKIDYVPARQVSVEVTRDTPPVLIIRGVVDETMMFGTQLRLTTEVSTVVGSSSLTIRDTVTNLSASDQEFQNLYHTNFGAPLLEGGAQVVAPVARMTPRDARAAEGDIAKWNEYLPPTAGYNEQVFLLQLLGDEKGNSEILLKNKAGDRGVSLAFSLQDLPYTTVWKNTAARENGYVTGLEPGTNFPNNRKFERENGRVPKLKGGESYHMSLTITVHTAAAEVESATARIRRLQGDTLPQLDAQPVPGLCP